MCPFCVSSTALVVAGVVSAGGASALVGLTLKKLKANPKPQSQMKSSGGAALPPAS